MGDLIYTGLKGGGKTYSAVLRMMEYVARGGCVYSNIAIREWPWTDLERNVTHKGLRFVLKKRYGWDLQEGQIVRISDEDMESVHTRIPRGSWQRPVLVVIDEALSHYNTLDQGQDNKQRLRKFLDWVQHARKLKIDLLFIVQMAEELNVRIRNKVENIVWWRDLGKMYVKGIKVPWPLSKFFTGDVFDRWGKVFQGHRIWETKDPDVYGCYDTDECHIAVEVGQAARTDFRGAGKVDVMTTGERIGMVVGFAALWVVVGFIGWSVMRQGKVVDKMSKVSVVSTIVTNYLGAKVEEPKELAGSQRTELVKGEYGYGLVSGRAVVVFDGEEVVEGQVNSRGLVRAVNDRASIIDGYDGRRYVLMARNVLSSKQSSSGGVWGENLEPVSNRVVRSSSGLHQKAY